MKNIAVILSGCGVFDGSEIHEAVATLLAIDKSGAKYHCFAPDMQQAKVINHLVNSMMYDTRNVLVESARLARGDIHNITSANVNEFDAAIYPGGFGAALNLCDFATNGIEHTVQKDVLDLAKALAAAKKPQGFICIAPALIAKIYGAGVKVTIGSDGDTIAAIEKMGNQHQIANSREIVSDTTHKVVTTPAYMVAKSISEVFDGIDLLVKEVIALCP
jgi:enhancing lycopene biosynthesis protein 2